MASYTLDTAAAIRELKDAECSEPLAEAIVGLVMKSQDDVATKSDIKELTNDIKTLEAVMETNFDALNSRIDSHKTETETNLNSLKTEMESNFNSLKTEMESNLNSFKTEMESNFHSLDQKFESKFDSQDQKFESKFESLDQKIETAKSQVLLRGVTALATCTGIIIAAMKFFIG